MHIFVKTLSGTVQVLEFPGKDVVSVTELEKSISQPGFTLVHDAPVEGLQHEDVVTALYVPDEFSVDDTKRIETHMASNMTAFELFRGVIKQHHAIVAGGSIVCAYHGMKINDFDIYVHRRHVQSFNEALMSLKYMVLSRFHPCSPYDQSFMRRNHIEGRFHFQSRPFTFDEMSLKFDVMMVNDEMDLTHVVENFDLTFCQVWWDGDRAHALHVHDVRTRKGVLHPEYIPSYMQCNKFTCGRIQKYMARGFEIKIENDMTISSSISLRHQRITHVPEDQVEGWRIRCLWNVLIGRVHEADRYSRHTSWLLSYYLPGTLTWTEWLTKNGVELTKALIVSFERNTHEYMREPFQSLWKRPLECESFNMTLTEANQVIDDWMIRMRTETMPLFEQLNNGLRTRLLIEQASQRFRRPYIPDQLYRPLQLVDRAGIHVVRVADP